MASGAKQKVGGRVTGCILNLGEFVTRANLYIMILGSYDVMIGMDWWESHEAILNCKTKWLSLVDDEKEMCYCRLEPGSFLEVHLFLATSKEHVQGVQDLCDHCVKQEGSS